MPSNTGVTIQNKLIEESTPLQINQNHNTFTSTKMADSSGGDKIGLEPKVKVVKRHKDQQEREKWGKSIEFVLSSMAFCIGLGNVWRFPYLCYKNGGGAFLIPYFICLFCGGIPVFFLEVALGQYTSQGGITVWKLCKIFKGIGYASCIIAFFLNIYYIVIIAWALHYLFASLTGSLPWAECGNSWNTPTCFDPSKLKLANGTSGIKFEGKDAVVEYWENRVLGISSGIDDLGSIRWELAGTLLLAWIMCYFCIFKGIKTSGKVVYFTATFPYLMMTILLIRGLTLPGAADGIKYYLSPNFSMIWNTQVWIDAGTQIFFSYAIALGTMTALGSYNEFNHNFLKDCTVITFFNSGTSLYAGFVIFSVLGFMAHVQGIPINTVAEKGPGLAFIAYPKAITQMGEPFAQCAFSICFFLMILMLGLGSQFVGVEGFVTAVVDVIPHILRVGYRRQIFVAIVSLISYLLGLLMVTNGGMYVFQLFDYYSASGMCLLWVCLFQCVAIAWVSPGIGQWMVNIKEMLGYDPPFFWKYWLPVCWAYITPLLTGAILLSYFVNYEPLTYNKIYEYPFWAQVVGWLLALTSMLAIPFYFMYFQLTRSMDAAEKEYEFQKICADQIEDGIHEQNGKSKAHEGGGTAGEENISRV